MSKFAASAATLAVVVLNGGGASASTAGSSGAWPAAFPLPTDPGTLVSPASTRAVVRSTDQVTVVKRKRDDLPVTEKGCTLRMAVNKPKDYVCSNSETGKSEEVHFAFAALDRTVTDPSVSQTNAFYVKG